MKFFNHQEAKFPYPNFNSPLVFHTNGVDTVIIDDFPTLKQQAASKDMATAINSATKAALCFGAVGIALLAETLHQTCLVAKNEHEPYETTLIGTVALLQLAAELLQHDAETTKKLMTQAKVDEQEFNLDALKEKILACKELIADATEYRAPGDDGRASFERDVQSTLECYRPDVVKSALLKNN